MTTIAYRDGVLAGDTRETCSDGLILPNRARKVWTLFDGSLFGASGDADECEVLKESAERGHAAPELKECKAIRVKDDGSVFIYEGRYWVEIDAPYYAIGTGDVCALVAMRLGLNAVRAVRIATEFDSASGGDVISVKLKKGRRSK